METQRLPADVGRIRAYGASLALAVLVLILLPPARGWVFPALGLSVVALLAWGLLRESVAVVYAAACGAALIGAFAIGASADAGGVTLAQSVATRFVAPELFLFFLASRLLSVVTEARFSIFYARPFEAPPAHFLSLAGASALAAFSMLAFYAVFGALLHGARNSPSGVLLAALAGASWIHIALLFLFFLSLSLVVEAALRHRRDLAALARLRRTIAGAVPCAPQKLNEEVARFGPSRAVFFIGRELGLSCLPHYEDFFVASRNFARGLPALLPLLGFFGTVVGLSITMFELEKGFAGGLTSERLAGALSGLGLKFETTLLGLFGNFIVLALFDLLERSEADCAAACRVLAAACKAHARRETLGGEV